MTRRLYFRFTIFLALLAVAPVAQPVQSYGAGEVTFLHALDNAPLKFEYRQDQEITEAVKNFKTTGENPYRGNADAAAVGKKLYKKLCRGCHLDDGTGRIGPNLVDDNWKYPRTNTDVGLFEIIYGGGAGAMQAFGRRIDQDEILKVMSYLEVLRSGTAK